MSDESRFSGGYGMSFEQGEGLSGGYGKREGGYGGSTEQEGYYSRSGQGRSGKSSGYGQRGGMAQEEEGGFEGGYGRRGGMGSRGMGEGSSFGQSGQRGGYGQQEFGHGQRGGYEQEGFGEGQGGYGRSQGRYGQGKFGQGHGGKYGQSQGRYGGYEQGEEGQGGYGQSQERYGQKTFGGGQGGYGQSQGGYGGRFGKSEGEHSYYSKFSEGKQQDWQGSVEKLGILKPIEQLNIGLGRDTLKLSAEALMNIISDEWVLFNKSTNFMANVVGPDAHTMFELFEEVACTVLGHIKKTGKLLRGTGFRVPNMVEKIKITNLALPRTGEFLHARDMIEILLCDQEYILQLICKMGKDIYQAGDLSVSDFITELKRSHRVLCWKLRTHLEQN